MSAMGFTNAGIRTRLHEIGAAFRGSTIMPKSGPAMDLSRILAAEMSAQSATGTTKVKRGYGTTLLTSDSEIDPSWIRKHALLGE